MNFNLNSNRSLLKPFWGENDKSLKLEKVEVFKKSSNIIIKAFQNISKDSPKHQVVCEIRRVTFQLKLSKSKVLEKLNDKLGIEGIELQNLYFFALNRNVKIKNRKKR